MIHRESILLRGNQLHALLLGRFLFLRFSSGHLIGFPFGFFAAFASALADTLILRTRRHLGQFLFCLVMDGIYKDNQLDLYHMLLNEKQESSDARMSTGMLDENQSCLHWGKKDKLT